MDFHLLHQKYLARHDRQGASGQRLLHECLREAIRAGVLAPGLRLPGSRTLCAELGLARNTVLYAYEQLATEGLITPDRRGSRVSPSLSTVLAAPAERPAKAAPAALSQRGQRALAVPLIAEVSSAFAAGVPALDESPLQQWRRLVDRRWRGLKAGQLNYADTSGEPALREAIADHLRATRAVRCEAAQVFVTDGTQASLGLCAQVLADAGDKVWIESPGYGGALLALRSAGLRVQGIAVDEHGMAPRPRDWQAHRPRLIYTTPSHQYPTGAVMSLERRLALLQDARRAGAWIIEDDYDSEFRHDGPPLPAMQGLLHDAPVLYLGTFSKTLFPGLRIGYVVAPEALVEPLRRWMRCAQPRGRAAEQLALADFLRDGLFGLHLRRMRRLYRQRRDALVSAVEQHMGGLVSIHGATAGMHLALRFEETELDDVAISLTAQDEGLFVQALSSLAVGSRQQPWRGLMLGYAQVPVEAMAPQAARLARCIEQYAAQRRAIASTRHSARRPRKPAAHSS